MTDRDRIERLERVLGTVIAWSVREFGSKNVETLMQMLNEEK